MPNTVRFAAIQMDAQPVPTKVRLARAAALVAQAAQAGAQVVVLPEVFNTGYEYSDANYSRVEALNGPTVTWMKHMATQHNIYLAGTLLLLDVVAEVTLPDATPRPAKAQPRPGVPPFAYFLDEFANMMLRPVYRRAIRDVYGVHMAPVAPQTRRWIAVTLLVGALGFWIGHRRHNSEKGKSL